MKSLPIRRKEWISPLIRLTRFMNKTKENTGADVKPDNSGHRERLKKRFMLGGGRDFPDYEMLELLLTLSIPRRDVKQIAKQLLAKFGSFAGVINAPAAALYEVPYMKFRMLRKTVMSFSVSSEKPRSVQAGAVCRIRRLRLSATGMR